MTRLAAFAFLHFALAVQFGPQRKQQPEEFFPSQKAKPNIVYILADDMNADWQGDQIKYMHNLRTRFRDNGAHFIGHTANVPFCGPSRASILSGRFPHNHGYKNNDDFGSVSSWCAGSGAENNGNNTIGRWLRDAGYYTSFLGKYINGCEKHVPSGWSHWGSWGNAYLYYNTTMFNMEWPENGSEPARQLDYIGDIHQADLLGNLTLAQAEKAIQMAKPFFISVNPTMPHFGRCHRFNHAYDDPFWEARLTDPATGKKYLLPISPCPTERNRHAFDGAQNPRVEAWNLSVIGPRPRIMKADPHDGLSLKIGVPWEPEPKEKPLDSFEAMRLDYGYRNRSASLLDLDDMLGEIMNGLERLGVLSNTYVFFTSDNGFHLGEHMQAYGKGLPYETDVRVPMYVTGPSVPRITLGHMTTHIDITATIVDLAGAAAHAPANLDGKAFTADLLGGGGDPVAWRPFSFSEDFNGQGTWRLVRVHNSTAALSYVRWCTGEDTDVYNNQHDQWQTVNIAEEAGAKLVIETMGPLAVVLGSCQGKQCSEPYESVVSGVDTSFPCYQWQDGGPLELNKVQNHFDVKDWQAWLTRNDE